MCNLKHLSTAKREILAVFTYSNGKIIVIVTFPLTLVYPEPRISLLLKKCLKLRLVGLFRLTGVAKEKRQASGYTSPSSEATEFRTNCKLRVKESMGVSITLD